MSAGDAVDERAEGGATVIAIDGPAGSGKSSVARAVARELGFQFLDTGAAYRALTWLILERGGDTDDEATVLASLGALDTLELTIDASGQRVAIAGHDVTEAIRTERISAAVAGVARTLPAREAVNVRFRAIIAAADPGIVAEGRDITTVVAPDADVRVLLTADEAVRIRRRFGDVGGDEQQVGARLSARDASDSRVIDFLHAADGVTVVDSTDLTFDETVDAIVRLATEERHD
ncbi:(d)CMP kinase [Agrococcus carbonis]|uniref:Cytidylate kinase n=1 Tax=Agrococcus carbonis TaxID=684552 RepID=A0A1H1SQF1_9MICO|nr:(d)CMP kinase [Agrococcus carbonis]SDS50083.1 cytidylate kinase [Agrococcus carbonis]